MARDDPLSRLGPLVLIAPSNVTPAGWPAPLKLRKACVVAMAGIDAALSFDDVSDRRGQRGRREPGAARHASPSRA